MSSLDQGHMIGLGIFGGLSFLVMLFACIFCFWRRHLDEAEILPTLNRDSNSSPSSKSEHCNHGRRHTHRTRAATLFDRLTDQERKLVLDFIFHRLADGVSIHREVSCDTVFRGRNDDVAPDSTCCESSCASSMQPPPGPSSQSLSSPPATTVCHFCESPFRNGQKLVHGTKCQHLHHYDCAMKHILLVRPKQLPTRKQQRLFRKQQQHHDHCLCRMSCPVKLCQQPLVAEAETDLAITRVLQVKRIEELLVR